MNQPISYSKEDLESVTKLVEKYKFRKIYITGDVKTGKSDFCNKFNSLTGYEFINLDRERDENIQKSRNEILVKVVKKKKNNSYILEHYQLLDGEDGQNTLAIWEREADILILLNPKRENIKNGADYDTSPIQKSNFDKLDGEIIYCNPATGTYVKRVSKNNKLGK